MVNSCHECESCKQNYEQFCSQAAFTYDSFDYENNENTQGGYSNYIVVNQDFAIMIPKNSPLEYVAPLMCAGITTYSPIVFSKVKKGDKVAIAGFGGLGVMALKYALHFGADVYVLARNNKKEEEEAKRLGAKKLYASLDEVDQKFDLIISTIPTKYDVVDYVKLLKIGGEMAILGLPPKDSNWSLWPGSLVFNGHKKIYGSIIGGIKETQEMLDFSLKNNIYPEIEIINPDQIDEAYEKMTTGKAKFRYVIDISKLN